MAGSQVAYLSHAPLKIRCRGTSCPSFFQAATCRFHQAKLLAQRRAFRNCSPRSRWKRRECSFAGESIAPSASSSSSSSSAANSARYRRRRRRAEGVVNQWLRRRRSISRIQWSAIRCFFIQRAVSRCQRGRRLSSTENCRRRTASWRARREKRRRRTRRPPAIGRKRGRRRERWRGRRVGKRRRDRRRSRRLPMRPFQAGGAGRVASGRG